MDTLLPYALLCFTSFFTLTNPLGTMPVFLTMTKGMSDEERQHIVKRATIISFITLLAFTFSGQFLFKFFGISTNGFRIAAGFIILKIGYDMLQARFTNTKLKDEEIKTYANDISITPLSIPMLCGPGAIANGIMLMDDANNRWIYKMAFHNRRYINRNDCFDLFHHLPYIKSFNSISQYFRRNR